MRARVLSVAAVALVAGCPRPNNYLDPVGPRYADTSRARHTAGDTAVTLRIVSFNIKYAERLDSVLALLRSDPVVMNADILTLQEMDAPGTAYLAAELGMGWVYYPARWRLEHRDLGNAILSRWPIEADQKILLPHLGRFMDTGRIAVAATIRIGSRRLRVYSLHLATWAEIGAGGRRDQVDTVIADAARHERVIIAGDFNDHPIGLYVKSRGYAWPTEFGPNTVPIGLGRWDHMFLRGVSLMHPDSTGTVLERRGTSDHRPVWAVVRVP